MADGSIERIPDYNVTYRHVLYAIGGVMLAAIIELVGLYMDWWPLW